MEDLGEFVVVDDGEGQDHLTAVRGRRLEDVALRPDDRGQRRDDFLADRIQRRIGHLGEGLLEVVEEQTRALGQRRHRCIGAHGSEGLGSCEGHGRKDQPQLLLRVAEGLLPAGHR